MDAGPLVDDLAAEQRALRDVCAGLGPDGWLRPTPSWQWDVRDTIAHLADTDEMAIDTATGGARSIEARARESASGEDLTFAGVRRGRRLAGADVLAWWESTSARERALLASLDPRTHVPWGLGMSVPAFVTARLMETWAHALDVHAALGAAPHDTDRLAHVAWLATRALPYAYSVAGRAPPSGPLRVELTLPSGATWTSGPGDAPARLTGPAAQYCRVFVQRLPARDARGLVAEGEAAVAALEVARAFL